MKRKIILSLIVIYLTQFVSSCCPDPSTFEVTYSEILTSTFSFKDDRFFNTEVNVKINKLDFVLGISMRQQLKQIALKSSNFSHFGFQKSYATSCVDDKLIYLENITGIVVNQVNSSNTKLDVTQNFKFKNYDNQWISVSDFINKRETWQEDFEFYLKDDPGIENTVKFEVIITFSTGKILNAITEEIQFN